MPDTAFSRTDASLIALRRILRATELFERQLAHSAGLTPAKLRVLQIVASRQAGVTPKELATQMGVAQGTVTALLDKLEQLQLVSRQKSDTDRRQSIVALTEAGRGAVTTAPDALQQQFVRAFEAMEDWEQAQMIASLERVARMLNAEGLDASPVLTTGDIKAAQSNAIDGRG